MNNRCNFVKISQAAEATDRSPDAIRQLAHQCKIPSYKEGKRWRVDLTALQNGCHRKAASRNLYVYSWEFDRLNISSGGVVMIPLCHINLAAQKICDDYGTGIPEAIADYLRSFETDLVILEGSAIPSIIRDYKTPS